MMFSCIIIADAEDKPRVMGDADGDGEVSMTDVTLVQRVIAKLTTLEDITLADVNGDGELTMLDVTNMQKFIAKLIDKFDVMEKDTDTDKNTDTDVKSKKRFAVVGRGCVGDENMFDLDQLVCEIDDSDSDSLVIYVPFKNEYLTQHYGEWNSKVQLRTRWGNRDIENFGFVWNTEKENFALLTMPKDAYDDVYILSIEVYDDQAQHMGTLEIKFVFSRETECLTGPYMGNYFCFTVDNRVLTFDKDGKLYFADNFTDENTLWSFEYALNDTNEYSLVQKTTGHRLKLKDGKVEDGAEITIGDESDSDISTHFCVWEQYSMGSTEEKYVVTYINGEGNNYHIAYDNDSGKLILKSCYDIKDAYKFNTISEYQKKGVLAKFALIADSAGAEEGFNREAWHAMERISKITGVEAKCYTVKEDTKESIIAKIDEAVKEGCNTVLFIGFQFGEAIPEVQTKYPDVNFIGLDITEDDVEGNLSQNVICGEFDTMASGYAAGYAAVKDGFTKLGFLGGMDIPAVNKYGVGYVYGADQAAKELKKNITVTIRYAGQFFPSGVVSHMADDMYKNGAEVIFSCGGGIYQSVLEAVVLNRRYMIGVDMDQSDIGSMYIDGLDTDNMGYNPVLTSAVKKVEPAVYDLLSAVLENEFYTMGGHFIVASYKEYMQYLGLPLEDQSWNFRTFKTEDYEEMVHKLENGEYQMNYNEEDPFGALSEYTTVDLPAIILE